MATVTETRKPINSFHILVAPLLGLWEIAFAPTRHSRRLDRIEALRRLSDAELATRGLKRGEILRHVYRGSETA